MYNWSKSNEGSDRKKNQGRHWTRSRQSRNRWQAPLARGYGRHAFHHLDGGYRDNLRWQRRFCARSGCPWLSSLSLDLLAPRQLRFGISVCRKHPVGWTGIRCARSPRQGSRSAAIPIRTSIAVRLMSRRRGRTGGFEAKVVRGAVRTRDARTVRSRPLAPQDLSAPCARARTCT